MLAPYVLGAKRCLVVTPNSKVRNQLRVSFEGRQADNPPMKNSALVKFGIFSADWLATSGNQISVTKFPKGRTNWSRAEVCPVTIENAHHFSSSNNDAKQWATSLRWHLFSLLIVDEAHHFPSSFWDAVVGAAKKHQVHIVFLTATPWRSDGKEVCTGQYHRLTADEARADGIIRGMQFTTFGDPTAVTTATIYEDCLRKVSESLVDKDRNTPLPSGRRHKAMILVKNLPEVQVVREQAKAVDIQVVVYHSRNKRREADLKRFEDDNNDCNILVVVDCLREGYDHPPISVTAICTKVVSAVKFQQFIGRGVRRVNDESTNITCTVMAHVLFDYL